MGAPGRARLRAVPTSKTRPNPELSPCYGHVASCVRPRDGGVGHHGVRRPRLRAVPAQTSPHPPGPAPRRPRADATRNRARVSDAAVEVFAEKGLDATVADVARRAEVGNATVFRHFPTKAHLLSEVAGRWMETWSADVAAYLQDDRDDTLRLLLAELLDRFRRDKFALDALWSGDFDDRMRLAREELMGRWSVALDRAVGAGLVAPDVTLDDLALLVLGMASRLSETGDAAPASWQRAARFAWAAVARPADV